MLEQAENVSASAILMALLFSIIVTLIALRYRFYTYPSEKQYERFPPSIKQLVGAFATYLGVSFILLPLIYLGIGYLLLGTFQGSVGEVVRSLHAHLSQESLAWLQLLSFCVIFLALLIYLFLLKKESRDQILWGGGPKAILRPLRIGALTWIVSYPLVMLVSQLTSLISLHLFGHHEVEQTAVHQIKALLHYPWLFTFMALAVVTLVPFVEELLFRGFLQSALVRWLGRGVGIVLSSALFALAHFSASQGAGNFELLLSLFILSLYLGFLYERERNLFAPMALHATFNGISIISILFTA